MKKKSHQRTGDERAVHDRATRLRRMTDEQLCAFVDSTYGRGMEEGAKLSDRPPDGSAGEEGARRFVKYLEGRTGSGNRIGKGTVIYIHKELDNAVEAGIFREEAQ